jgi:hypothetical protein
MLKTAFFSIHNLVFSILPVVVLLSFFFMLLSQTGFNDITAYTCSAVISFLLILISVKTGLRNRFEHALHNRLSNAPDFTVTFGHIVVLGLALRLCWFFAFDVELVSDYKTYFILANRLIAGQAYEIADTFAYWPVGYPFFLKLVHLGVIEVSLLSIFFVNIVLYVISSALIFGVARQMYSQKVALISVAILAFWPTNFSIVGMPFKEYLIYTILAAATYLFIKKQTLVYALLIGILLGFSALAQPGTLLFVSVFIVVNWAAGKKASIQILHILAYVVGLAFVISPWTYRNYQLFDDFVLISTNGGSNFFRANNDYAHGGYLEYYLDDIEAFSEVDKDKLYKEQAVSWIKNNPDKFFALSFRKMLLFLGDDSTGFYLSLKQAAEQPVPNWVYLAAKLMVNLFWLALWILIFMQRKQLILLIKARPDILCLTLGFLYFLTIHSVFESNAKYHFPPSWMIAVLAAISLSIFQQKPAACEPAADKKV